MSMDNACRNAANTAISITETGGELRRVLFILEKFASDAGLFSNYGFLAQEHGGSVSDYFRTVREQAGNS